MTLKIRKLCTEAELPVRGSASAAGYDIKSIGSVVILPGKRAVIPTGISIEMPPGVYGRIAPRSGLAVKHGIQVGAGVIDADYRGELKVVLFNHDDNPYVIKPGYRIAQLILEQCMTPEVQEIFDISDTSRGGGGFGSTGV